MSVEVVSRMASATTFSPKVVASTIFAAVAPYLTIVLLQFQDTGVVEAASLRALLVGFITGLLTFVAGYLANPGQTVDVLVPDGENDVPPSV